MRRGWLLAAGIVLAMTCTAGTRAQPAGEGVSFQVETRGPAGAGRESSRMIWWQGRMRDDSPAGALILDTVADRLYLVDHQARIWFGGAIEAALADMERENRRKARLVREAYNLPEPAAGPLRPVELRREPGEEERVAGVRCRVYRFFVGDELQHETWFDSGRLPGAYLDLDRLLPVLGRFAEVNALFRSEMVDPDTHRVEQALERALLDIFPSGLEIRSREHRQGRMTWERLTRDIRTWSGDESAFLPPADYRQVGYAVYLEETLPDDPDLPAGPGRN